jgi:hypothetical protein
LGSLAAQAACRPVRFDLAGGGPNLATSELRWLYQSQFRGIHYCRQITLSVDADEYLHHAAESILCVADLGTASELTVCINGQFTSDEAACVRRAIPRRHLKHLDFHFEENDCLATYRDLIAAPRLHTLTLYSTAAVQPLLNDIDIEVDNLILVDGNVAEEIFQHVRPQRSLQVRATDNFVAQMCGAAICHWSSRSNCLQKLDWFSLETCGLNLMDSGPAITMNRVSLILESPFQSKARDWQQVFVMWQCEELDVEGGIHFDWDGFVAAFLAKAMGDKPLCLKKVSLRVNRRDPSSPHPIPYDAMAKACALKGVFFECYGLAPPSAAP